MKDPITKSRVETARRKSSNSWRRIIHFTPARLIPSKPSRTTNEMALTAQMLLKFRTSEMDSANPVTYIAPATH